MNRRSLCLFLLVAMALLLPFRSPAPLFYTPGEGWYYEPYGEKADWMRPRAKDQLDMAEQAFTNKNYSVTLHAAHRIVRVWPLSDYAPRAEYLIGRCLEVSHKDEAAFNAYEAIIQKYPRSDSYEDVLWRQYGIANRFLGGEFSDCGAQSRFTVQWIKQPSCSAPSSPTGLTATSRRARN